ncbi:MAG TPA: tetratricopeptide repeat protein, partial [Polyangiales bacterium]|nr:tetratricopeptide repeat protein [Polyangiales bacterium]
MSIDRAKAQKAAQKYLAKGQIDRAISEYEKVVTSDPSDARSLLKLGDLYTRQGDNRGAVGAYRKVAAQYAAQGFFLKAVAVYKQILKLDGNDLAAIEALADMYEKLSLASDALAAYEQVADAHARAGKPEKALLALGRMAELDKENVAAWIRYAEALSKADRIDEASNAFRRGADLLKQQGRMEDFIKVTERLLFHSHEDLDRARELAGIYIARGQPKSALAHLQTCFKVDPRDVATLELLARAFAALDQTPKAISVYRELARVHAEAERTVEEADALRALLDLAPHDADTARRLQVLEAATAPEDAVELLEDGDDDVVIVDDDEPARSGMSSAPPNPDVEREAQIARLMAECEVFLRYGLRDKVIAQLGRVLDLDPAHLDAREKLKDELLKRGDRAQAVVQLLALATHAGDPAKARAYLEQAAAIDPSHAEVASRLRAQPIALKTAEPDDDVIMVDDEEDETDFSDLRSFRPPPRPAPQQRRAEDEADFSDLRSIIPAPAPLPTMPVIPSLPG